MRDHSAQIRTLLRIFHRPHQIERNAFALKLKEALGAASAQTAFTQVIEQAFENAGDAYTLHRRILQEFDIFLRVPRSKAAAELGVSDRRFFYLHSEAIAVVERYVTELLQSRENDGATSPALEMLLDADPARAMEVFHANGSAQDPGTILKQLNAAVLASNLGTEEVVPPSDLRGPHGSVALALRSQWLELHGRREEALANLHAAYAMRFDHFGQPHRLAEATLLDARVAMARHDADAFALSVCAKQDRFTQVHAVEAALATGDVARANELVQAAGHDSRVPSFRFTALVVLRRAQIALLSGDYPMAAENARMLALIAKPHGDIADMAAIVHERACVALGWPLAWRDRAPHGVWYDLYDRALLARSVADGTLACEVFILAGCSGYHGVAAHAAATLAFIQNDLQRAQDAWFLWLRGCHFEQGFDLMPEHLGRALLATQSARACVQSLAEADHEHWPVLAFLTTPETRDLFWKRVLDAALNQARADTLGDMMTALLAKTINVDGSATSNAHATRRLARLIAVVLPFAERTSFIDAFTSCANYCNARARRRRDQLRARLLLRSS